MLPASGPRRNPWERLLDGEVDAIITDISDGKAFETLEGDSRVKRLCPDYVAEDRKLYAETGVYPVMHLIVMSKKLDREQPDLARKLYDAFDQAKSMAYTDILNDRAGFSVVYLRERLVEQQREWGDPWKYGVAANRNFIDAFVQYNVD
jgi:4,5-dihydroxyphthalate decarboxylase